MFKTWRTNRMNWPRFASRCTNLEQKGQAEAPSFSDGSSLIASTKKSEPYTNGTLTCCLRFKRTHIQGTQRWKDLLSDLVILFNGESMMNLDPYVDGLRAAQREHPDISRIMVTGHSLGGTMAWAVATRLKDLGHADVSGHVFNPGSTWDMDKYFTEERLSEVVAHHVVCDPLSAGWSKTEEMISYKPLLKNTHSLQNSLETPSRMGPERWKHPENVVGTRQWYQANNLSYKRGARDAGRGDWVHCGTGAVQGELKKKSVPRWPATKVKEKAKKSSSFTSKVSLFLSKDVQRSAESLLSLSGSQSLPSIVLGQVPYPPTPAFVRDMMRRWCEEDAAREERERQEAEEAARLLEEINNQ
ncbi:unnamed protein product [Symbiodinium sp. CCMP2456]|nr:unnamed protein product [Symbiodinium sp. CCMP2456]